MKSKPGSNKAGRLQTEVKSCSSVPTTLLNGIDFGRFVVAGREQTKDYACAREFDTTGGVVGAPRCSMPGLQSGPWFTIKKRLSKGGSMHQYKNHPIYGIGVRGAGKEWHCRGLIFEPEDKVTEIKRLECAELTFATKLKAEEHALKLCKKWIDEQTGGSESSSLTHSAPLKAGASAI